MGIPGNFLSSTTESIDPNTSGWTAKLNCTLILGSGGRNGDGVLALKSTASGEMQARTVSSYAVTAGTVYQAFADASGATVPERIGIRWMSASNSEISVTWSLTTSAATSSWHRIGVAGAAPTGAVRAYVLLSATPAASNVINYFENVFFGHPIRTPGNLFSFAAESSEVDASAWTAETNATIGRLAPPVLWPVDSYYGGGQLMTLTATANGNSVMRTVEQPAVTPGVDYMASAYLTPPSASSVTWIELRFHDGGGTQISATRSTLAAPASPTGLYKQRASAIAPAGAATCSVAVGIDSATAGQVLRVETLLTIIAPVIRAAGSIVPYADASFEQGVAGWTVISGVATLARSSPWGTFPFEGSYSLTLSSATATSSTIRSGKFALPAGAGTAWRFELVAQVTAGGWTSSRGVRFYDAANNDLGLAGGGAPTSMPSPGWYAYPTDVTAPAGATQAALEWTFTATSTSSVLRIDQVAMWEALPLVELITNDDTASISITLRELVVGQLLTLYRILEDGSRTLVRGPAGLYSQTPITTDLMLIEDYEAPLGVPVYYRAEMLTLGATVPSVRPMGPVTLNVGDPQEAWLKDPGNPQRNAKVLVAKAPDWQRAIEQAEHRIRGRRNSVILSDVRGGLEGDLQIWTRTDDERAALHWLLDSGTTILWQAAPGMGISDMYVAAGQVTEARTGGTAMEPWRAWTLPLKQVDMPVTTGVAGSAGRTWQDILTGAATWQAVLDTYATWEDVLFDHKVGG